MDSEESHLGEFTSGSFLGEVRAMYDSTRHTTSVKATEDSLIFVIQRSDLIGFLDNNPGLHIFFLDYNYIE
jgi:CRP-like cAMP-binding protein